MLLVFALANGDAQRAVLNGAVDGDREIERILKFEVELDGAARGAASSNGGIYAVRGICRAAGAVRVAIDDGNALRELEQELERADFDGINMYEAGRTSLNDCFDKYIESKCELRESTKSNYIYMYNKHIRNGLGGRMMSNFKYSTILTFYKELIYKKVLCQIAWKPFIRFYIRFSRVPFGTD